MDVDEDPEAAWNNWDIESDSNSSESEAEDWIDVASDGGDHLDVSDSDSDAEKEAPKEVQPEAEKRVSSLATTKVHLTASGLNLELTSVIDSYACRFRPYQRSPNQSCCQSSGRRWWISSQAEIGVTGGQQVLA